MGAAAAAVMIRKERELVDHFRSLRAVSPESARPRQEFQDDSSNAWNRLIRHAVIREAAPPGTWYVDKLSYAALRNMSRRVIAIILVVVLLALLTGILIRP